MLARRLLKVTINIVVWKMSVISGWELQKPWAAAGKNGVFGKTASLMGKRGRKRERERERERERQRERERGRERERESYLGAGVSQPLQALWAQGSRNPCKLLQPLEDD